MYRYSLPYQVRYPGVCIAIRGAAKSESTNENCRVPDPWHFDVDQDPRIHANGPDPDPAIFVIDLQDANKKLIKIKKFLLITPGTFWRYIYIIIQW